MKPPTPKCPACGRRGKPVGVCGDQWYCGHCQASDNEFPDEGGTHSDHDPSWRMQREERRRKR